MPPGSLHVHCLFLAANSICVCVCVFCFVVVVVDKRSRVVVADGSMVINYAPCNACIVTVVVAPVNKTRFHPPTLSPNVLEKEHNYNAKGSHQRHRCRSAGSWSKADRQIDPAVQPSFLPISRRDYPGRTTMCVYIKKGNIN